MIPAVIAGFLIGAVLSWRFRVWILVPVTLVATIALASYDLTAGTVVLSTIGHSLLAGLAPQLGYAFGLLAQGIIVAARTRRPLRTNVLTGRRPFTRA